MNAVIDTHKPMSADSHNFQIQKTISLLRHENDCFQAENSKVKQHYKELYDSIKITRDKTNEKITSLLNEIENLKTKAKGKMPIIESDNINSVVCKCKKYACEAVFIPLPLKNNELFHSDYLRHLKNCLDMTRKTIEEDIMVRPSDNSLSDVCFLTKRSQELLEYAIGTCPKIPNMRDRNGTSTSRSLKKHVRFDIPLASSDHSTSSPRNQTTVQQSNVPIVNSTGVINITKASGSKPRGNTRNDRTSPAKSDQGKKVEDHLRNNKIDLNEKNRVDSSICVKRTVINSNSNATCKTCNGCLISGNHDECVVSFLRSSYKSSVKFAKSHKLENNT
jgi:gas vesicle protein